MWTPSEEMSPEATYSSAWVEQPHSGWIRNSASGCSARTCGDVVRADPGVDVALAVPDVEAGVALGVVRQPELARDERAQPHVGAEKDLGLRPVLGPDVLDDLDRVRGGAAVVGLGLHLRRGVDVHHDDRAGVLGLPRAQLVGVDRVRKRAAGVQVGDENGLIGGEHGGGLGHEVDAAEGDDLGLGRRRLARELERVAGEVGDVLDLRHLVVVGEDDRVALGGQRADLVGHARDLLEREVRVGVGLNCREALHPFRPSYVRRPVLVHRPASNRGE